MPIIREHIASFVEVHNAHTIRKQKNRPYLPTGKPYDMFYFPETLNYATKVDKDDQLFNSLLREVEAWNPDEYLTRGTIDLCTKIVVDAGFELPFMFTNDEDAPHVRAYKLLRVELYRYEANGGSLTRITPPVGGKQWIRYQAEVEKERQEEIERQERRDCGEAVEPIWQEALHEEEDIEDDGEDNREDNRDNDREDGGLTDEERLEALMNEFILDI